jgi:hypothetical protein
LEKLFSPRHPPKRDIAAFVGDAFGFETRRGESSAFTRFVDFHEELATWCRVRELYEPRDLGGTPEKLDGAIARVAERSGVSHETIRKRYKKFQERVRAVVGP